jgi:hypothetical protein
VLDGAEAEPEEEINGGACGGVGEADGAAAEDG